MEDDNFNAEYERVMTEHWRAQARHEYWFGLFNVLKHWASHEQDIRLSWPERIFYTLKAVVCMLINRRQSHGTTAYITVTIFDEVHVGPCGGALPEWAENWNQVVVGVGILKGWWYDIYNDSNC